MGGGGGGVFPADSRPHAWALLYLPDLLQCRDDGCDISVGAQEPKLDKVAGHVDIILVHSVHNGVNENLRKHSTSISPGAYSNSDPCSWSPHPCRYCARPSGADPVPSQQRRASCMS